METMYFEVVSIDGDYANLKRTDAPSDDLRVVAMALLPEKINEGSRLRYEMFEYMLEE
ncbi:MAG: chorismate--pyruvate lyase [Eubacterium sp.]|nr:chorismate--pyruvate lyase [Eubacterium sp.]